MQHQLEDDASQLEEQVEDLAGDGILAVGVFEVEFAVLLDVEAFVFNFPTQACALIGKSIHVMSREGEIGDPLVVDGFALALRVGAGLLTFDQTQLMSAILAIHIEQVFRPAVLLFDVFGTLLGVDFMSFNLLALVGELGNGNGKTAMQVWQIVFAQDDEILPVIVRT